ncbi:hypothetical protein [Glutamicibacter sp. NPDC087344]|uniref:hypothetical protein n=1 Tax=Glutamicibacter sp. NPDC087344 TaxID=3363994 RepID=UPI0038229879
MTKTLPMSRFIQHYNQHLTSAEQTDSVIILEQRAGRPAWVLESEQRVCAKAEATNYLAAVLATFVRDEAMVERFSSLLVTTLPWTVLLPERDREQFVVESAKTLQACASIGRYTAFADLIEEWRNTAEVWADPTLAAELSGDISQPLGQPVGWAPRT